MMCAKTMEGLVGARTSMDMTKVPLRVFKEARRRGDTATMERAMGYVNEFSNQAQEYKAEVHEGMKEDGKEAKEREKSVREKAAVKLKEESEGGKEKMNIQGIENNSFQPPQEVCGDFREGAAEREADPTAGNEKGREWFIKDEYIPEDKNSQNPAGIYKRIQDESGRPKIQYADPHREKKSCTGNTDQVDREIEKLRQQKTQLEQRLNSAKDEKKAAELERKLAQVENELRQKDNDIYRRQHTVFYEA